MKFDIENGILVKFHEDPNCPDVVIPDEVTELGKGAFYGCSSSVRTMVIHSGVTAIGDYALNCINLRDIKLSDGLKYIGREAFKCCIYLEEIVLPKGVKSIGDSAFVYCGHLLSAFFYDGIEEIGEDIFNNCMELKKLTVNIKGYDITIYDSICKINGDIKEDSQRILDFLVADDTERLNIFKNIKRPLFKIPVALFLLVSEKDMTAFEYIKRNIMNVVKHIVDYNETEYLKGITAYDFITKKNIDGFIGYVQNADNREMLDILLEYKKNRLGIDA